MSTYITTLALILALGFSIYSETNTEVPQGVIQLCGDPTGTFPPPY